MPRLKTNRRLVYSRNKLSGQTVKEASSQRKSDYQTRASINHPFRPRSDINPPSPATWFLAQITVISPFILRLERDRNQRPTPREGWWPGPRVRGPKSCLQERDVAQFSASVPSHPSALTLTNNHLLLRIEKKERKKGGGEEADGTRTESNNHGELSPPAN